MVCITHCRKDMTRNLNLKDNVLSSYTFRYWGEHFKVGPVTGVLFMKPRVDFVLEICQERQLVDPDSPPDSGYASHWISHNPANPNPDNGLRAGYNACLMVIFLNLMDLYPHVEHLHEPSSVTQENALHVAVRDGNERAVTVLLDEHPLPPLSAILNGRDYDNRTPLMWACIYHRTNIIQQLLSCRSNYMSSLGESGEQGRPNTMPPLDLNATDRYNWTALFYALNPEKRDIAKLLLAHPSDPPLNLNAANHFGATALHIASSKGLLDTVQVLLNHPTQHPIDLNATDHRGWTALHAASYWGKIDVVKELLGRGAALNIRTASGETPLMLTLQDRDSVLTKEGKRTTESYLLSLPDIDLEGYTPLV